MLSLRASARPLALPGDLSRRDRSRVASKRLNAPLRGSKVASGVVARASSTSNDGGLFFVEKRHDEDGSVTFVFGDEAEAAAAAAARASASSDEVAAPQSVLEATAVEIPPSPAPLSEDAAFEAMEAFGASSAPEDGESAAFEAMEAFAAAQKATAPPPTLPLREQEEKREEEEEKSDYPVAAVAAAIKEVEEYFSVSSASSAEEAAVDEEAKEEEVPVGEAPVSAPAIDAAAGLPHFDATALKSMKVAELKKLAAEANIKGYSKMKKADILAALLEGSSK